MSNVFYVYGNWGTLECALDTGLVQYYSPEDGSDGESLTPSEMALRSKEQGYFGVVRCDIDEYRATYPGEPIDHMDILDIGTWDSTGQYEPASDDFRTEARGQSIPV